MVREPAIRAQRPVAVRRCSTTRRRTSGAPVWSRSTALIRSGLPTRTEAVSRVDRLISLACGSAPVGSSSRALAVSVIVFSA
ncbi:MULTISPECIES: hypothetical protein [Nocardioides]|uniref:Uncharacterized protein n=1 Tax=Nocardioides vastitatis TaxID=2568655 RepID=A0ABW0ZR62_9ACTN|nr:hypothetical protein [Nocardioides sp.]THJ06476.1 hypothetical protein E7Z54_06015 [Nocardioides sp.]